LFGSKPAKLPDTQSTYRMSGDVTVYTWVATQDTRICARDSVEMGEGSAVVGATFRFSRFVRFSRSDSPMVDNISSEKHRNL